jgi:hypothetical protein
LALDTPSASQLRLAIRCELIARCGKTSRAAECLSARAAEEEKAGDFQGSVWLLMKWAELLCLDRDEEAAWKLFNERVSPLLSQLDEDQQAIVRRNFSFVGIILGHDTSFLEYYEAVDQTPEDEQSVRGLLAAEDASRKGQHFDSLPALWRELNRSFLAGDWGGAAQSTFPPRSGGARGWLDRTGDVPLDQRQQ